MVARPPWVEFAEAVCHVPRRGSGRVGNGCDEAVALRGPPGPRQAREPRGEK